MGLRGRGGGEYFKRRERDDEGRLTYALSEFNALEEGASWMVPRTGEKGERAFIPRLGAVVF